MTAQHRQDDFESPAFDHSATPPLNIKKQLVWIDTKWRRGRDLNPWNGDKPFTHFPGERLRPLSHLSACIASIAYNKLTERIIAYSIANVKIDQAPSLRLFWKKIRSNSAHSSFNIPDLTIHLWYILGSLRML